MRVGLPALFLHTTGIAYQTGSPPPISAILFNGVPLLFNGEFIIYTS